MNLCILDCSLYSNGIVSLASCHKLLGNKEVAKVYTSVMTTQTSSSYETSSVIYKETYILDTVKTSNLKYYNFIVLQISINRDIFRPTSPAQHLRKFPGKRRNTGR